MKPVALLERMIRGFSRPHDIVLDPLGGSGSTLIAAENLDRKARLVGLDPKYVDVIVKRWNDQVSQSRSLLDFVKIVELFDKYKVSFVTVTQSFNTSNPTGRL
jgi:DNA modification methylase